MRVRSYFGVERVKPEKCIGRLKLVEEMMRENGQDSWEGISRTAKSDVIGVFYESDDWASMLEELQAVIAEIEKDNLVKGLIHKVATKKLSKALREKEAE